MKNLPIVIGLVGYKQSGKTTTFNYICDFLGKKEVQELMLAGKLKKVCSKIFHTPIQCFEDQNLKEVPYELPIKINQQDLTALAKAYKIDKKTELKAFVKELKTPRQVLQFVGTEILRQVDEKIHCQVIGDAIKIDKVNVVTDIRFQNEYDYFKNQVKCKFIPIHISRLCVETNKDTHASEKDIKNISKNCTLLDNNGTLDDLRIGINKILKTKLKNQLTKSKNNDINKKRR
jgi:hypothetical protein